MATERDTVARAEWREAMAALDARRFVFVDETSSNITLTARYARAPRQERAYGSVPRNYAPNTTILAALSPAGIQAALTLDGAVTGDAFAVFVRDLLCPTLVPGQIVILDNLSAHKRESVRLYIEAVGCHLVFLPAYSPDFAPIEQAFSKFKGCLRRIGARTQEALDAAIAQALRTITATDAYGWFHHCGYDIKGC